MICSQSGRALFMRVSLLFTIIYIGKRKVYQRIFAPCLEVGTIIFRSRPTPKTLLKAYRCYKSLGSMETQAGWLTLLPSSKLKSIPSTRQKKQGVRPKSLPSPRSYVNLKDRIQETRRAEHDLRHHMALMAAYLEDGEYDRLRAYLDEYRSSLPEDSQAVFCRNHTANLLLSYFARQAADAGVGFAAYGNLPADLGIAESDLSVILRNLLENALQACMAQEGSRRQIVFRGKMEGQCLLVTVDNTFEGELRQEPNGALLSTKRGGSGLGLESVRHIAARYGGMLRTECRDGMFCASVLLKL